MTPEVGNEYISHETSIRWIVTEVRGDMIELRTDAIPASKYEPLYPIFLSAWELHRRFELTS
jgi:hypothetical protein